MATVLKSGSLSFLEPSGPVQACNGIALPFNKKEKVDKMSSDDSWHVALIMCKLCPTKSEIPVVSLLKVHVFWDVMCLHLQGHTVDILTLKKKKLRFLPNISKYLPIDTVRYPSRLKP